jgi:hypothetical protein
MAQRRSSSGRRTKRRIKNRRYSKGASNEVRTEMRHYKRGKHGSRVKSRKQAIAIGLSKARRKGKKVPPRRKSSK